MTSVCGDSHRAPGTGLVQRIRTLPLPWPPFALLFAALMSASAWAQQPAVEAAPAGGTVVISGELEHTLTLSVEALKKFKPQQVTRRPEHPRQGPDGKPMDDRYTGCLLRDVLNEAGLTQSHRRDLRHSYVLVTATDGYQIVFSWGELFNTAVGDGVFFGYERNGAPINDAEGHVVLFSLSDTAPGPRFSRGVKSVQVLRAQSPRDAAAKP